MRITPEQVARDFLKSGEKFNTKIITEKYNIDISAAGHIVKQFERSAGKYTCEFERKGRHIIWMRLTGIDDRPTYYKQIRDALQESDEFMTPPMLVERYGVNQLTAGQILHRLRKDPTIHTESKKIGQAIGVRIIKAPEVELSKEDKLWRVLTTKNWGEMFNSITCKAVLTELN